MRRFGAFVFSLLFVGLGILGGGPRVVQAQTGPGGVGTTDGKSDLRIWLRADDGVNPTTDGSTVSSWTNQAGTSDPTKTGNPTFQNGSSDLVGGEPVVRFDGTDDGGGIDQFDFGTDFGVPGQNNTLIVVARKSGDQDNQSLIGFGAGNEDRRTIEYNIKDKPNQGNRETRLLGTASGNTKGQGNSAKEWAYTDAENVSNPSILSSLFSSKDGRQYLRVDGDGNYNNSPGPASTGAFGDAVVGQNVQGDIAEVIAFSKPLNAAEYKIVYNYLAEKYDVNVEGTDIEDLYSRDSFTGDLAGIGRADKIGDEAETGSHQTARSDVLELSFDSFAKGEFVLFGHNEASRTFSSADRPNDDADVERLSRVWRTDFTGSAIDDPTTFTSVTVDAGPLSLGSFDDYAVFVSSNADFSDGATFYNLTKNGDTYEATDVEIGNGDYVAVARLKRTVTFTSTTETIDEGNKKQLSAVAELNYPDESDITFSYNATGDLDGSGSIEDGGTSNVSGTNNNGDYEADGGTGSQSPTDYDVTKDVTTIPAGKTKNESKGYTFEVDANDDTVKEQTEKFGFTITGTSGAAQVGSDNQLTVSIFDNDEDRKVRFAEDDYTGNNNDPNYDPQSTEGDGGSVRTNKYTLELDSGVGNTANSGEPCTSVKVVVNTESSDAIPGTDFSDGSVADFRIKNEADPGGTCSEYQERVSATEGRVYFAADATEATLKLEINEDDFEDADTESIVLDLSEPISSRLGDTNQQTLFNIEDDDGPPSVGFTSSGFSGDESQDGEITLGFTNGPVGTDIGVELNDTGDGSAKSGGDDYTTEFEGQNTISEGSETKTVSFSVNDDTDPEKNEDIVVEIQPSKSDADTSGVTGRTAYTILDNDGVGATGPGGVGKSGSLRLWLRADKGVTSSSSSVSKWVDQSGNGNDVTQSDGTNQPTYDGGSANGITLVNFDGTDDYLETTNLASLPGGDNTVFAVSNSGGADGTLLGIEDSGFNSIRRLGYTGGSGASAEAYQNNTQVTASASGLEVLSTRFDGNVDINVNAGESSNTNGSSTNADGTYASIGSQLSDANAGNDNKGIDLTPENTFGGTVGEVIVYQRALNTAQRRIVANYLAAKYGLSGSLANDDYKGDTGAGFDQNVFGIGAEGKAAEAQHNRAEGEAVTLAVNSFSAGDYVFVGDTTYASANDINVNAAGDVSELTARSDHVRYIDTKGQPTFDITIDLEELGLQGPAGSASNYRLLFRTDYGSQWSTPNTVGGRSTSGDEVTFSGVKFGTNGQQDGYITIGTTNQADSPLDTRLTTVRGTAGADGSDEGWRYYGPPGSRDSGPVQMGEIRLRTPNGQRQSVSFEANMSYTWSSANGEWVAASSGTEVPAGRGTILFLYDDKYFPIDQELTIDPKESGTNGTFSYTGDTDVTVGDGTPTADDALMESVDSHLLANPYEVTYDLGSLQTLNQDGDGDGTNDWATAVQVWDYSEDTDGGDPRGTYKVRSTDPAKPESDRLVSPGQAFFLERNDLDGNGRRTEITFSADGRQDGQNVDFVGSKNAAASTTTRQAGQIKLRLQVHENGNLVARDRAASLYFREGADSTWDAFDAPKLVPWDQSYATIALKGAKSGGEMVLKAQESQPYQLNRVVEVPLALTVEGISGEATLSAPEWWEIPSDWTLTLVDTKGTEDTSDDVEHNLRRDGENPYTFSVGESKQKNKAASSNSGEDAVPPPPSSLKQGRTHLSKSSASTEARFKLRVNPGTGPLPVEMADLSAQTDGRSVQLQWTTASETNNAGFYVEHKRLVGDTSATVESDDWTRSGFVEGSGTTESSQTYRHRVSDLDYGRHAFRLRQVDTDGDETVTEVVKTTVRLDGGYDVSAPYPNPVRQQATFEVTVRETQPVRIELYDVLGRRVRTVHDEKLSAQQTRRLQIEAADLPSGVYFLQIRGEDFSETKRMTVVQ